MTGGSKHLLEKVSEGVFAGVADKFQVDCRSRGQSQSRRRGVAC